eukprot:Platyproteum_vivax@DN4553_c0_g1_i1.p2
MLQSVAATKRDMVAALQEGISLVFIPGGVSEMFARLKTQEECLCLKNRKGFIKVAMQTESPIVPVYAFGQADTYHPMFLTSWLQPIANKLRMALPPFWGRFSLPVPFRLPLLYIVGRPVSTAGGMMADGSVNPAAVSRIQSVLMKEFERLFTAYRDVYGWGGRTLRII